MMRALPLALILSLSGVWACSWGTSPGPAAHDHASDGLYTCPMHPEIVRDQAGSCPICGMDLVPATDPPKGAAGTVHIEPGVVQQMGVETAVVAPTTVFRHIRTLGEVEVGEDELAVVNLRYSGWVERIYVDKTGDEVRAGQALFDIYSPELVAAQEEFLLATRSQGPDSALARSARRRLQLWDVAERDIAALVKRGTASRTLPVRAPQSGFILHKNLVEGARIEAGKDLYRIGNLQRIWVTAEVYEHDAGWVEVGQAAQLELTNVPGASTIEGSVSYIYPTLDRRSRTLSVRLEFDNPGVRLKPGMFATVYIQYRRKDDVIAVPTEAILQSGRRQVVFVDRGKGHFVPRPITTGLRGDHRLVEVTSGLEAGEVVVTKGQFLIDSESQLQEALARFADPDAAANDPAADEAAGPYVCPMHPHEVSDEPGRCSECGMFLEKQAADETPR